MYRIWVALALAAALCFGGCALAQEDEKTVPIPCAAAAFDTTAFEDLLSWTLDAQTGVFSFGADAFEAVLDYAKRSGVGEAIPMQLKWIGNARTGLVQPVLEIYYIGSSEVKPGAVSLRVGDMRYDLLVKCEEVKLGARRAERLWAPLTRDGMALVRALNDADAYSLRLHGQRTKSIDVKRGYTGSESRKKLESASFDCLTVPDKLDMGDYGLWDLNAAMWKAVYGFGPRVDTVALSEEKGFDVLSPGNSGASVRALQKQLIERQFLMGSADSSYGERLREAVLRAQKHYGLMQTGSADARLTDALAGNAPLGADDQAAELPLLPLGNASLRLDRYWFAQSASISAPIADAQQDHSVGNLDNILVIFDGSIQNTAAAPLGLDSLVTATLYLDGIPYSAACLCERDRGSAFDVQLLPQAKSRLVIAVEVPRTATGAQEVKLILVQGNQSMTFLGGLASAT